MSDVGVHKKAEAARVLRRSDARTLVVSLERHVPHPVYKKYITRTTTLLVQDDFGVANEGDVVRIQQCRPYSRHKRWHVVAGRGEQE